MSCYEIKDHNENNSMNFKQKLQLESARQNYIPMAKHRFDPDPTARERWWGMVRRRLRSAGNLFDG